MSEKVILHNIRGVKKLEFELPTQKGVYLLAGINGSGKTSLLVAINRIGCSTAFSDYNVAKERGLCDLYEDASVEYQIDTESVSYVHGVIRWVPTPKMKAALLSSFTRHQTKFISTSGFRFYQQLPSLKMKNASVAYHCANEHLRDSMNKILGTKKFDDLMYVTVKPKRGKQRILHRQNKLYAIKISDNDMYSEICFSLGERLVLNTLDLLSEATPKSIIMIDEIELALHPTAQVRFYDYLKDFAESNNQVVIISTHSASLIKHAKRNMYYLEKDDTGNVEVIKDCSAAYILKDISATEEMQYDNIFLVEDVMAERYMGALLKEYREKERRFSKKQIKILYVGSYPEVIKMSKQLSCVSPYNENKVHAFLDADVRQIKTDLFAKPHPTEAEKTLKEWFDSQANQTSYLDITPELGFWKWLLDNSTKYEQYLNDNFNPLLERMASIISNIQREEAVEPADDAGKRKWAKGCLKNLVEKIQRHLTTQPEETIYKSMFDCMAKDKMNNERFFNERRRELNQILSR